jgi:hypothetical protein
MMVRRFFLSVLLSLSFGSQAQSIPVVRGSVVDVTGAAVPGAPVLLETPQGTVLERATSDAQGKFSLPSNSAGDAELVVPPYSGFAAVTQAILVAGLVTNVTLVLRAQTVSQEANVDAGKSLSTDSSANRDTISVTGADLRKLPIFDQDPIAALTPFLDPSSSSSGGVILIVDGIEMNSLNVSPSAIQEVHINNDPYSAEFNRPGRGRIEIITKPGSPNFHGEVNFTFRDAIFNAKNHFATVRPPESRRIYEGHLSGPVGDSGHSSFIVSASRREDDTAFIVDAIGPAGPINQNVLAPTRNSQFSGRINHDFSPGHRLSVGYDFQNFITTNAGIGGIVLPEAGYNKNNREDDAILNDRLILSPHLINQLQVLLEKQDDNIQSATNAPSIQVSGSFTGGGAQADLHRSENTIHVNEVITWSRGKHYVRAGIQLPQFSRRAVDDRTDRLGTFKFDSLAACGNATPTCAGGTAYVFTAQQGSGRGLYWINEFGSFIQDQIQLSPKLQLLAGLRYDWQTFLPDNNNLAPRLALAYGPGKGKSILRVGTGLFYDRTGGDFPATVKLHDGIVLHSVQLANVTFPLPPTNFDSIPTNLVRFDPNVRTPYAIQYSVGMERQIFKAATVTVGYRGQVQVKSFRSRDANAPVLPPNSSLLANYPRPNPNFGQIQQIESGGRSLLNALDVSFRGQAGRWFSGQAQYTLSRFENNTGGINWFPQDQYHPNAEWGRADLDRLSRFNILGNINPDHWLSLGIGVTLYSGTPYAETTGADNFHTGLGNARPAGVGRNTLDADGVASLDVLYNHDFRLTKATGENAKVVSAGISAFNVLNRTSYTSYIGTQSSSLFGQPTAALPGRQLQFAMGYRF